MGKQPKAIMRGETKYSLYTSSLDSTEKTQNEKLERKSSLSLSRGSNPEIWEAYEGKNGGTSSRQSSDGRKSSEEVDNGGNTPK